jgi:hypothetical protein
LLRKDYIQRQFEEFGKVLASLLNLKLNKNWEEFEKQLNEAFSKYTPFELEKLEHLSIESFQNQLHATPTLVYEQKKILASLLFERMNVYLEQNKMKEYELLKLKCLALYEHLSNDLTQNEYDLEVHYRLKFLKS